MAGGLRIGQTNILARRCRADVGTLAGRMHRARVHQKSAEWRACTESALAKCCHTLVAPWRCQSANAGASRGPGIAQRGPAAARAGAIRVGFAMIGTEAAI
ncbi:hypothetical protein BVI2075_900015 [Burkholderia vietnamiensis]|nr:hypothetical protein BVI2075_900015 [Burkholderia vietnamiensis]